MYKLIERNYAPDKRTLSRTRRKLLARSTLQFSALWVIPGSPYESTEAVIDAIRWARESGRPFLGTCGGFQHAVIEFARNVTGLKAAEHAESNSAGHLLIVNRLARSLIDQSQEVHFTPASRLKTAYGRSEAIEHYHCNYGINPVYLQSLENTGSHFAAWDKMQTVHGIELQSHPFFAGTLFQPDCVALYEKMPPVVMASLEAINSRM